VLFFPSETHVEGNVLIIGNSRSKREKENGVPKIRNGSQIGKFLVENYLAEVHLVKI